MSTQHEVDRLLRENGMHAADIDMELELVKFKADFFAGLSREGKASLMMLPSYIPVTTEIISGKPIIAVDAGGTNLRVAVVSFDDHGEMKLEDYRTFPMPGVDKAVTSEQFFETLAGYMLPISDRSDTVGFCFSYPFNSTDNRDAEALPLGKEVEVIGIEGALIGEGTERALKALGAKGARRYTLINDTVAAMLAGALASSDKEYDGCVGLILGTGLNTCCAVQTSLIEKANRANYLPDSMIINMEIGNYNGFSRGTVDRAIDARSNNPGAHVFEKMVSGAYMGTVILDTIKLAARAGLFSEHCCERTLAIETLSLKTVDQYLRGEEDNELARLSDREVDVEVLGYLLGLLYARAAKLLAVALCGILECTDKGADEARPVCICAEGTTFHKSEQFRELLNIFIGEFVIGKHRRYLEFIKIDNATLVGTAVAGMMR